MVCRSRLHIARPQSLTNVRKSTQLPTFVSYWRLVTGWLTANRQISTWKISILHGAIFYFPRGRESFPPKFHLIPPKFYFFSTWRIFFFHVDISKSPRGDLFVPPLGSFRSNADGTNSSHKYGTTLPDYLPYYIRSLVDTGNT